MANKWENGFPVPLLSWPSLRYTWKQAGKEPEAGCSQETQSLENSREIIHRGLGMVSTQNPKHNHMLTGVPKKKHIFSLTHSARVKRSDLPKIYTLASPEDSLSGLKICILNHSTTWSSIKNRKHSWWVINAQAQYLPYSELDLAHAKAYTQAESCWNGLTHSQDTLGFSLWGVPC